MYSKLATKGKSLIKIIILLKSSKNSLDASVLGGPHEVRPAGTAGNLPGLLGVNLLPALSCSPSAACLGPLGHPVLNKHKNRIQGQDAGKLS